MLMTGANKACSLRWFGAVAVLFLAAWQLVGASRFKSASINYEMTRYDEESVSMIRECRVRLNVEYTIEQTDDRGKTFGGCDGDYRAHGHTMKSVFDTLNTRVVHPTIFCVNQLFCSRNKIKDAIRLNGACIRSHEVFGQLTFAESIEYTLPCDSSIRLVYVPGTNLHVFGGKDAIISAHMAKSSAFLYMTIRTLYRSDRLINSSPQIAVVPQYLVAHSTVEPLLVSVFDPNEGDQVRCRWPYPLHENMTECVNPDVFQPYVNPARYRIEDSSCVIRDYLNSFLGVKVELFPNCSLSVYFPETFIGRTYHFQIMAEDFKSGETNPMSVVPFAFMLRVVGSNETRRAVLGFSDPRKRIQLTVNELFTQNITCQTYCPGDTMRCLQTLTRIAVMQYPDFVSLSELRSVHLNQTWKKFYKQILIKPRDDNCNDRYQICAYCSDVYSHSHINCQVIEVTVDSKGRACPPKLLKARCRSDEVYCGSAYNHSCAPKAKLEQECLKCDLHQCTQDPFCSAHHFNCETVAQKGCLKKPILCGDPSIDFLDKSGETKKRLHKHVNWVLGLLLGFLFFLLLCIVCTKAINRGSEGGVSWYYSTVRDRISTDATGSRFQGSKINAFQDSDEEELN